MIFLKKGAGVIRLFTLVKISTFQKIIIVGFFFGFQLQNLFASCPLTLGTDLRITGSTTMLGQLAVNQDKFIVSSTGNTTVGGVLDVTGTFTAGSWHHITGQKTVNSIGSSATTILSLNFTNLAGSSSPLFKGAVVKLRVVLAGLFILDSVNYYESTLFVSPGATGGAACILNSISELSTNIAGTPMVFTASISGTGTAATLRLANSVAATAQSVAIFYEIFSDNISSVS